MFNIDLTYLIPTVLFLLSIVGMLLYGPKKIGGPPSNFLWYLPILSTIVLFIGVFVISSYYEEQNLKGQQRFWQLQHKAEYYYNRTILDSITQRQTLDSLKTLNSQLIQLLEKVKKQEAIVGQSTFENQVKNKISATKEEIGTIESYNEIISVPKFLMGGHTTSGNTTDFIFSCPNDSISEFIDLKLKFRDSTLVDMIACMYIEIIETRTNGENWGLFYQAYKPKRGVNGFKVRNYLRTSNVTLYIGYVLKTEGNKRYPKFDKITCHGLKKRAG